MRVAMGLAMLGAVIASGATGAPAAGDDDGCYDAAVRARPIAQIPSVIPECDDCIIMRWPWFVDLQVVRVKDGDIAKGRVGVLNVQHGNYIDRVFSWWLRRNDAGGWNVIQMGDDERPHRCAIGSPPVPAYLKPAAGKTLEDLRREGEERYRSVP